ncbi:MAG TPA: hypothetical protein EYH45_07210 [Candidatus Caldiarchaeum subterraneum]|uniref:Uncharacterized protein n=1 Tax=Caldiarchaeum subterraneum TaxID=311458 RepID=A0A832ZXT9_CALS0|nr:hypothetical protein [Candidatus Caldarchaeum subterraneum]
MGFVDLLVIALSFTITTLVAVIYTLKHFRQRRAVASASPVKDAGQGVRTKVLVRDAIPRVGEESSSVSAQLIASRKEIEEISRGIGSILKEVEELD